MKKSLFIFVLALITAFMACKKDEGLNDDDHKSKFIKTYGTLSEGKDIKQTGDGGYIMFGTIQGASSTDLYLKKVDAFGNDQWSKTYDGPSGGTDEEAAEIIILDDGGYLLLGTTTDFLPSPTDSTILLPIRSTYVITTNYLGMKINTKTYNSGVVRPETENENGYGVSKIATGGTFDGDFLVVSEKTVTKNNKTFKTGYLRLIEKGSLNLLDIDSSDATGSAGAGSNIGYRDIVITSNSEVVVTGFVDLQGDSGQAEGNNVLMTVFDQNAQTFEVFNPYGGNSDDIGHVIKENSAGEVLIAGFSTVNSGRQFYVLNFSEIIGLNVNPQWRFTGSNLGNSEAFDIVEVADGYVVAGYNEVDDNRQFHLTKLNSNGKMLWENSYGYTSFDEALAIVTTDDDGLAVLGTSSDERNNKIMTLLKLDASGNLR